MSTLLLHHAIAVIRQLVAAGGSPKHIRKILPLVLNLLQAAYSEMGKGPGMRRRRGSGHATKTKTSPVSRDKSPPLPPKSTASLPPPPALSRHRHAPARKHRVDPNQLELFPGLAGDTSATVTASASSPHPDPTPTHHLPAAKPGVAPGPAKPDNQCGRHVSCRKCGRGLS